MDKIRWRRRGANSPNVAKCRRKAILNKKITLHPIVSHQRTRLYDQQERYHGKLRNFREIWIFKSCSGAGLGFEDSGGEQFMTDERGYFLTNQF